MSGDPLELPKRQSKHVTLSDMAELGRRLQVIRAEARPSKSSKAVTDGECQPSSIRTRAAIPKGITPSRLWLKLRKCKARPRKIHGLERRSVPPTPPPTPRNQLAFTPSDPLALKPSDPLAVELFLALDQAEKLADSYRQTDELAARLLEQATENNRELIVQGCRAILDWGSTRSWGSSKSTGTYCVADDRATATVIAVP